MRVVAKVCAEAGKNERDAAKLREWLLGDNSLLLSSSVCVGKDGGAVSIGILH